MNKNLLFNICVVIGAVAVPILALFGWSDFHPDPQWAALTGAILPAVLAIIKTIQHHDTAQALDSTSRELENTKVDLENEQLYSNVQREYVTKLESKFVAPHGLGVKVDPATQLPPVVTFIPAEPEKDSAA